MREVVLFGPNEFSAKIQGPASTNTHMPLNFRRKFVAAKTAAPGVIHG